MPSSAGLRLSKGRAPGWAGTGKSCYKSGESHEEVSDGRAERWTAAGPLPRERGRALRLRSPVARDRPAAGGARRARHTTPPPPPRGRRGAPGRRPLQDTGPGGRPDRPARSGPARWRGPRRRHPPAPVLHAPRDESSVRVPPPAACRASLPEASEARIAEVADLLAGAARPLVIAGSGVDRAGANEPLLAVVERLG